MRRLSWFPLLLLCSTLLVACGDDTDETGTSDPSEPTTEPTTTAPTSGTADVTVTRPDGSSFEIDGPFRLECGQGGESDEVEVVRLTSRLFYEEDLSAGSGLLIEVDPTRVEEGGSTITLPLEDSDEPDAAILFVVDLDDDENELSSTEEEAGGTMRVLTATCDPQPRLVVEFDATLGSEFADNESADVVGALDVTGDAG